MALYALRLRRVIPLSSSIFRQQILLSPLPKSPSPPVNSPLKPDNFPPFQSRQFRSSTISLSSRTRSFDRNSNGDDEIGPDTILFEGCDYEHWLIVVDFPKDVQLSRETMIETYVETAAKVFGSVEEAKKKIYALSTTTYKGFQVLCSEETSKKFEGLPGVVFVLPDSYIDPVNKEYGGDKYINGEIIERPPPPQFRRSSGPPNRPPRRGPQFQQGNYGPPQQNYGPPQQNYGAQQQNYGAPQGPPRQNYGAQQQNYGAPQGPPQPNYGAPQGPPSQQNFGAPQGPPSQQNFGAPQGPPSQQNFGAPQGPPPQQNYGQQQYNPPPQENNRPQQPYPPQQNHERPQNYGAPQGIPSQWNNATQQTFSPKQGYGHQGGGWDYSSKGERQESRPPYQANYNQGEQGNYFAERDQRGYTPQQHGNYGQGPVGGEVQGTGPTFGQNNPRQGEDQRTFAATDAMGRDQGR